METQNRPRREGAWIKIENQWHYTATPEKYQHMTNISWHEVPPQMKT